MPKQVGGSVIRSRVKRRLRELIRRHWADIPDGYEAVLHAYPAIVRSGFRELEDQVTDLFRESVGKLQSGQGQRTRQGKQQRGS